MDSSSPESSQELHYPPVQVSQSLASLDLNALIMRSNLRRPAEESTSLDESTYEVLPLSDSVYATSDDEGHTASVASTTPDDVSNFSDDEDNEFEHEYIGEASQQLDHSAAGPLDSHGVISGDESTLTDRPYLGNSESVHVIKLHEDSGAGEDCIDAAEVVHLFDDIKVSESELLNRYGCPQVRFTVRACLSTKFLPVNDSFRILYVGNIDEWAEKDIQSRLGAALDASPGPSRSIMVRGQMEPMGPMLESDHCKEIELFKQTDRPAQVQLTFDRTQLVLNTERTNQGQRPASLPDIVVFWYPSMALPDELVEKYPLVRQAFEQYQIPCLDIALAYRCGSYPRATAADAKSLRLCVEGKKDQNSEFELQEVIPVDIYTFTGLDPSQLNRHLAALSPRSQVDNVMDGSAQAKNWNLRSYVPNRLKKGGKILRLSPWPVPAKVVLSLFLLTAMSAMCIFGGPLAHGSWIMTPKVEVEPLVPLSIPPLSPVSTSNTVVSKSVASSVSSAPAIQVTPRDLTVVPPTQQPSQRKREPKKEEKFGGFEIQATGEHQFVLSPSKDFVSRKRTPQLQIQVSRDTESIPIRYVRTAGGIYIVDLEQEYPVGSFNVSIATHSKPLLQQSFKINMGRKKSRVEQMLDRIRDDLTEKQQLIRNISSALSKQLGSVVAEMEAGNHDWKQKACHSSRHLAGRLQGVRKEAERRVATGTALVREFSGETWMGLRKVTAPMRTSRAALRARDNAFHIRCGVERVLGLSSWDKDEKKTRSCKKVGW